MKYRLKNNLKRLYNSKWFNRSAGVVGMVELVGGSILIENYSIVAAADVAKDSIESYVSAAGGIHGVFGVVVGGVGTAKYVAYKMKNRKPAEKGPVKAY